MVATHDLNMYNLMRGFLGSAVPTSALRAATDWIPVLRNPRLVLGTGVSAPATSAWSSGGSSAAIGSNNLADYSGSCTSCHHTEPAWPPQAGPCSVSVQLEEWANKRKIGLQLPNGTRLALVIFADNFWFF